MKRAGIAVMKQAHAVPTVSISIASSPIRKTVACKSSENLPFCAKNGKAGARVSTYSISGKVGQCEPWPFAEIGELWWAFPPFAARVPRSLGQVVGHSLRHNPVGGNRPQCQGSVPLVFHAPSDINEPERVFRLCCSTAIYKRLMWRDTDNAAPRFVFR